MVFDKHNHIFIVLEAWEKVNALALSLFALDTGSHHRSSDCKFPKHFREVAVKIDLLPLSTW